MTRKDHGKILSTIFFIFGVLDAVVWIMIGGFYGGEWMLLVYAAIFLLAGFNMHNKRPAAKPIGIIASVLCLMSFPIGTAIGIYGMWYFIYAEKEIF